MLIRRNSNFIHFLLAVIAFSVLTVCINFAMVNKEMFNGIVLQNNIKKLVAWWLMAARNKSCMV